MSFISLVKWTIIIFHLWLPKTLEYPLYIICLILLYCQSLPAKLSGMAQILLTASLVFKPYKIFRTLFRMHVKQFLLAETVDIHLCSLVWCCPEETNTLLSLSCSKKQHQQKTNTKSVLQNWYMLPMIHATLSQMNLKCPSYGT